MIYSAAIGCKRAFLPKKSDWHPVSFSINKDQLIMNYRQRSTRGFVILINTFHLSIDRDTVDDARFGLKGLLIDFSNLDQTSQ